jgi:GTP-binding protein HflX
VDAAHPDWQEQFDVVDEVLAELKLDERPQVLVFNKVDRLTHEEEQVLRDRVRAFEARPAVFVSALLPGTLGALRETLKARIRQRLPRVQLEMSADDGELLARLYREGEVIARTDRGATIDVTARIPDRLLGQLRQREGIRILEVA